MHVSQHIAVSWRRSQPVHCHVRGKAAIFAVQRRNACDGQLAAAGLRYFRMFGKLSAAINKSGSTILLHLVLRIDTHAAAERNLYIILCLELASLMIWWMAKPSIDRSRQQLRLARSRALRARSHLALCQSFDHSLLGADQ